MKTGAELIAQERQEQIEKHGIPTEWDIDHNMKGEIEVAVRALVLGSPRITDFPVSWMSNPITKKMAEKPFMERAIIAGALCAALVDMEIFKSKREH